MGQLAFLKMFILVAISLDVNDNRRHVHVFWKLPNLVTIGEDAFYDCTKLSSFTMGNRLETIGFKHLIHFLRQCLSVVVVMPVRQESVQIL